MERGGAPYCCGAHAGSFNSSAGSAPGQCMTMSLNESQTKLSIVPPTEPNVSSYQVAFEGQNKTHFRVKLNGSSAVTYPVSFLSNKLDLKIIFIKAKN